jgi:hypothetical protein
MFKHHGLRTRKPMRRDTPTDAPPTDGGGSGTPPAPAPAPTAVPPAADPLQDPAVQAAIRKATADAEAKARTGSKENARKEAITEIQNAIATALGVKPAEVDPAALGAELAKAKEANNKLLTEVAVGRSARVAGGDEDMVTAWLSHKGLLRDLDPTASDFADKVDALVKAQIEANPKLQAGDPAPVAPMVTPGRQGPASTSTGGGSNDSGRPGMAQAIQEQMAMGKK